MAFGPSVTNGQSPAERISAGKSALIVSERGGHYDPPPAGLPQGAGALLVARGKTVKIGPSPTVDQHHRLTNR